MVRKSTHRKTHLLLLFFIFLMLAGSSVWLKYTLAGDRTGQAVSKPLWLQEEPKDGIVHNLTLSRGRLAPVPV